MREGWEIKKLGEVCTFQRGLTYTKSDEVEFSENCVLRSNNIDLDTMSIVLNDLKYVRKDLIIGEDKIIKPNTILICMSNGSKQHIGKVAFIDRDYGYAFGGFMGLIIPRPTVFPKYIYYGCLSPSYKHFLAGIGNGINITNLKFSDLANYAIPIPPLSEQERIVAELDLLSEVIAKKREQLTQLDALAQSLFYTMFGDPITNEKGWETKRLGDVCQTSAGGTPTKGRSEYYDNGTIPWLRSGEINKMYICNTGLFINELGLRNSSAKWFPKNTVVIAMYGATVGQVGILCHEMTTNQAVCGIFPNKTFAPIYLYHFLLSQKENYIKIAAGGAQPNISQNIVRNTLVCCPPLALQQQFAEKIEAIEQQKERIRQSLAEVQLLFDSRMDYYFNN